MSNKFKQHEHKWIHCLTVSRQFKDVRDSTKRACLGCGLTQYYHDMPLSRVPHGWYDRILYR